ncbi:MAG: riboflavin synthase subunit alpha [Candidatus Tectimicrobiota bacterium]|nr:MAG: riboflavin synthase subunit alpha [Candidatus Tectomicrobia bacterium]
MFTGIVEETGTVLEVVQRPGGVVLTLGARRVLEDVRVGDSIAVNGVCLTVVRADAQRFTVELAPETLRKTTLGQLRVGDAVNLERALAATGRLGGHFVQGHVDATGDIVATQPDGDGVLVTFRVPPALMKYVVPKGYIAVDGMSLTVVDTGPDWFRVSLIPHTRAVTVARHYTPGRQVNLEVDILGKYVEKLLASRSGAPQA